MKRLQKEFEELNEYLNKLETSYNQSLDYINHLEAIISHVLMLDTLFHSATVVPSLETS